VLDGIAGFGDGEIRSDLAQRVDQLAAHQRLVVDDQNLQHRPRARQRADVGTPAGTRNVTVAPRPGALSTCRALAGPNSLVRRWLTLSDADAHALRRCAGHESERRRRSRRFRSARRRPAARWMRTLPPPPFGPQTVEDRILDQGCTERTGTRAKRARGIDVEFDPQPLRRSARARSAGTAPHARVPHRVRRTPHGAPSESREVIREVDDQIVRALGIGARQRRDRGQRVEEKVRRPRARQRVKLGLGGPAPNARSSSATSSEVENTRASRRPPVRRPRRSAFRPDRVERADRRIPDDEGRKW